MAYKTIKAHNSELPLGMRISKMASEVQELVTAWIDHYDLTLSKTLCLIEQPENFGSVKSAGSVHSGNFFKLAFTAGAVCGAICSQVYLVYMVPVTTWKGQTPKHVTKHDMEYKYKTKFATSDECDAVGLADWYFTESKRI